MLHLSADSHAISKTRFSAWKKNSKGLIYIYILYYTVIYWYKLCKYILLLVLSSGPMFLFGFPKNSLTHEWITDAMRFTKTITWSSWTLRLKDTQVIQRAAWIIYLLVKNLSHFLPKNIRKYMNISVTYPKMEFGGACICFPLEASALSPLLEDFRCIRKVSDITEAEDRLADSDTSQRFQ